MDLFRSSISSITPSSSTISSTAASDPHHASISTPPTTGPFPRAFQHRPSATPTTTTNTTDTSTSSTSTSRVLSTFNPTKTYHIPSHGGLLPPLPLRIYDLTPLLKNRRTASDPYSDRKLFKREVRAILKSRREPEKDGGNGEGGIELGVAAVVTRPRGGGMQLEDSDTHVVARWSVPWALWRKIVIDVSHPGGGWQAWNVSVSTHDFDPRSQVFEVGGASYRWRFVTARELVLEKSAPGIGRYVVAVFYLTRGIGATEGTLLLDERGVDRVLCVATVLVALKRERQRWGVLGGTV